MNELQPGCTCCLPDLIAYYTQPLKYHATRPYDHAIMPRWVRDVHEDAGFVAGAFGNDTLPSVRWGDIRAAPGTRGYDVFYMWVENAGNNRIFHLRKYNTHSRVVTEIGAYTFPTNTFDPSLASDIYTFKVDEDQSTAHCVVRRATTSTQVAYAKLDSNTLAVQTSSFTDYSIAGKSNVTRDGKTIGWHVYNFNPNANARIKTFTEGVHDSDMQVSTGVDDFQRSHKYQNYGQIAEIGGEIYTISRNVAWAHSGQPNPNFLFTQVQGNEYERSLSPNFAGYHGAEIINSADSNVRIWGNNGADRVVETQGQCHEVAVCPITDTAILWDRVSTVSGSGDRAWYWRPRMDAPVAFALQPVEGAAPTPFFTGYRSGFGSANNLFAQQQNYPFICASGFAA